MKAKIATSLLAAAIAVSGCAGMGAPHTPVVDVQGSTGKDPAQYASDLQACQTLATTEGPSVAVDTAKNAGIGGSVAAGTGALIGWAFGVPGLGAAVGGAAGAAVGGLAGGFGSNMEAKAVVDNCLRGRGWNVV